MSSLRDVAKTAGVSARTVNRVLKNNGRVAKETRQRVNQVIDELGYRPNRVAQSLRTGKSTEVNVLITAQDELHMVKMESFEEILREHGYAVSLLFCSGAAKDPDIIKDTLATLVLRCPAAVAVFPFPSATMAQIVDQLQKSDIPYVAIDSRDGRYDNVGIDRQQGVYRAVEHLHAAGRRHIAYFAIALTGTDPPALM